MSSTPDEKASFSTSLAFSFNAKTKTTFDSAYFHLVLFRSFCKHNLPLSRYPSHPDDSCCFNLIPSRHCEHEIPKRIAPIWCENKFLFARRMPKTQRIIVNNFGSATHSTHKDRSCAPSIVGDATFIYCIQFGKHEARVKCLRASGDAEIFLWKLVAHKLSAIWKTTIESKLSSDTLTKVKKTISRIKCVAAWWVLLSACRVESCRPTPAEVFAKWKLNYTKVERHIARRHSVAISIFSLRLTEGRVTSLMPKATVYFVLNECMRSHQAHLVAMFAFRLIRDQLIGCRTSIHTHQPRNSEIHSQKLWILKLVGTVLARTPNARRK